VLEVGTNYQIAVEKDGALDRVTVRTEIQAALFTGDVAALEQLKARIAEQLKSDCLIKARVELHEPGSLPAFELKAKRVVDTRPKE
jgi:phenylacetate-CoA ligase